MSSIFNFLILISGEFNSEFQEILADLVEKSESGNRLVIRLSIRKDKIFTSVEPNCKSKNTIPAERKIPISPPVIT